MVAYDLAIRGGTIVDGTRVPSYRGDVFVRDGRIAQIGGRPRGRAQAEIDAAGLIVAPGFVDLHTHYDAQIQWDPHCSISGWHGVTSVVLGNCGFGFAPVRPEARERAMLTMSRTEAIPLESMRRGMLWDWVTFPEWLETLERIPKGVNCLTYMPVAPLMIWVMGLDAAKTRPATAAEKREMQRLLHEAMDHGACGFSIQRLGRRSVQADFDGTPMVTDTMCDDDILALAEVLRARDEGFVQITQFTGDLGADLRFQEKLAEVSGRPILHNVVAVLREYPDAHRKRIEWLARCQKRGLRIYGQTASVRSGFAFTLEHWNLYDSSPAWNLATTGTFEEKVRKLRDPEIRAAIKRETDAAIEKLGRTQALGGPIEELVVQSVDECGPRRAELEPFVGRSLSDIAGELGRHPIDAMLDLALEGGLKVEFLGRDRGQSAEMTAEMILSPYCIPGVSDGGAHTKFFTGGAYTTDFLTWLVRDTGLLSLEEAHYRLSYLPACAAGFKDRGFLREGAPADLVVYDLARLDVDPPWVGEIAHDFPGGEWRRVQHAKGYRAIVVNGEVTFEEGKPTGVTPGKLLRHGHA
jgi:N-acyl-D-aspartate/D-glutamate deacylase